MAVQKSERCGDEEKALLFTKYRLMRIEAGVEKSTNVCTHH